MTSPVVLICAVNATVGFAGNGTAVRSAASRIAAGHSRADGGRDPSGEGGHHFGVGVDGLGSLQGETGRRGNRSCLYVEVIENLEVIRCEPLRNHQNPALMVGLVGPVGASGFAGYIARQTGDDLEDVRTCPRLRGSAC